MTDPDDDERMTRLEARIKRLKQTEKPTPHQEQNLSQAHLAWRMVIELVTGLLIGFGAGYGLDSLFGTMPVFLVLVTLLGLAAGIRTMMRSAREVQQPQPADAADDAETPGTGDGERVKDGD